MWKVDISVTNLAERRIRATATRTEGVEPDIEVRSYSLEMQVPLGITFDQTSTGLCTKFWDLYQAQLDEEDTVAAFLGTIAAETATKLDAKGTP